MLHLHIVAKVKEMKPKYTSLNYEHLLDENDILIILVLTEEFITGEKILCKKFHEGNLISCKIR